MFGCHIHKGTYKNYVLALKSAMAEMEKYDVKMASCQVFVMGPQNTHENFTEESAREFGKFAGENGIKVIVHNSYLVSLWNNDQYRRPFARMNIQKQLKLCDDMNAAGFVIHIPNESIPDIVAELGHVNLPTFKTPVYLETKAANPNGKGARNYELPANLDKLFTAICEKDHLRAHVGHCIDSAHLWSSGLSLSSHDLATKYFHALNQVADGHLWGHLAGNHPALIFHLNDALNDFGTGKDEHAILGKGQIWGNDKSGLKVLIDFIKQHNLIAIFERNKGESLEVDCQATRL